jgi:hypothetical protein
MKTSDFLPKVAIVADAEKMHQDHEVQMAREECYHIASNAIELHKLLQQVSETTGLDGWVSEKISLANDYCRTVKEYLEYELMTKQEQALGEDASVGASTAAGFAVAPAVPLFKKRKIIKRKMP